MFGFKNSNVYIEGKGIIKCSLAIKDNKFYSFDFNETFEELDDNFIIVPGFIDEHIHGANDSDVMDASLYALENMSLVLPKEGVTSFLATTMTMEESKIIAALNNIGDYKISKGAELLGVHLEGPFISKVFIGAQDKENIVKPTKELIEKFIKASNNKIKVITIAPEETNEDIYKLLKEHNIIISAGHTNATFDEIKKAIDLGLTTMTHTYNVMKGFHHREVGTIGASLLFDELACEVICDLHHSSKEAIQLLYKNKPKDKLILITDSMEAKFLLAGEYSLGGQKVFVKDSTARLIDNTLAGSILHMNDAVRNLKDVCKLSLEEAIDKATINPAKNLRIDKNKGSISLGKDADFVIIDRNLNVYRTYVNGKEVYRKE